MLTGDLVRARVQKDRLRPSFIDPEAPRHKERAEELVALFAEGLERQATRGELQAEVKELIGDGTDHKITRGLAKLLEDKAEFVTEPPVDPLLLRESLWTELAPAPSRAAAEQAWLAASERHGLPVDQLRGLLFADRKSEQQLQALPPLDAAGLLHRYNVALVQAVLLSCTQLVVRLQSPAPERLRQLFRALRFHQLMYRVVPDGPELVLTVDGPASLLRLNTRYGRKLASWFPHLLLQPGAWTLEGEVLWTKRRLRKTLELSSELGLRSHARDVGAWRSRTEQWFEERFLALDCDWRIQEHAAVIDLGGRAVICPSFSFTKGRRRAHLEIVGFWRKDWLQRRLELIEAHGPGNLVLAVSTKLEGAKQGLGRFKGTVIPFREVVPAKDVLEALEACAKAR